MLKRVMTTNQFSAEFWPNNDSSKNIDIPDNEIVMTMDSLFFDLTSYTSREHCLWNSMVGTIMSQFLFPLPDISWEQNDNARI